MVEGLVVDASVVSKLYLADEQDVVKAELLFARFRYGEVQLAAPRIITYEVPAAIKKGAARSAAPETTWREALSSFQSLGLTIIDDSEAKCDAVRLAIEFSCQYYDALYLLLAEDLGWRFLTADERFCRNVRSRAPYVLPLASYE